MEEELPTCKGLLFSPRSYYGDPSKGTLLKPIFGTLLTGSISPRGPPNLNSSLVCRAVGIGLGVEGSSTRSSGDRGWKGCLGSTKL